MPGPRQRVRGARWALPARWLRPIWGPCCALWLCGSWATSASAKDHSLSSPTGRRIYHPRETFAQALDHQTRRFVAEVAAGLGPEGTLALLLGVLNLPVEDLDAYVGFGMEANPAQTFSVSARYTLSIGDARPYLNLGYFFKDTIEVGVNSHNAFAEVGHRWRVLRTYHLMFGVGVRRNLRTWLPDDSSLRQPEIDPVLLDEQLARKARWLPTFVLRFSRAF